MLSIWKKQQFLTVFFQVCSTYILPCFLTTLMMFYCTNKNSIFSLLLMVPKLSYKPYIIFAICQPCSVLVCHVLMQFGYIAALKCRMCNVSKHRLLIRECLLHGVCSTFEFQVKMTQINFVSRNQLHNIADSCQHLNFGLSWPGQGQSVKAKHCQPLKFSLLCAETAL